MIQLKAVLYSTLVLLILCEFSMSIEEKMVGTSTNDLIFYTFTISYLK